MHKRLDGHRTDAFRDSIAEATGSGRVSNSEAKGVWMTWDMVREMRDAGMCFGGHTVNHPILSRLDPVEQDHEIEMCLNRIESELGERVIVFSYPDGQPGSFDEVSRACVQSHGIRFAFAHSGGFSVFDQNDPYAISRMPIERDTSFAEFRAIAALPQVFAY